MGKPSSNTSTSRTSTYTPSNKSSKMNVSMRKSKMSKKKLKKHRKIQNNIRKLFSDLRRSGTLEISDMDNTVIDLEKESCTNKSNKRKTSESSDCLQINKRLKSDSVVIVNEDPEVMNVKSIKSNMCITPSKALKIQCSTPINKNKESQENLIQNNNTLAIENLNNDISNLTKEINEDSYLTIDLTNETLNYSRISKTNAVINLDDTADNNDCTVVSVSNASSMSNDSDVTVLYMPRNKQGAKKEMGELVQGISKLNASKKGKMLEYIMTTLLNGCEVPEKLKSVAESIGVKESVAKATETAGDAYIKEMIVGQKKSRNSIGSNIYNPDRDLRNKTGLRMVVIDGSNVAMEHGKGKVFSVKGLKICIEYFLKRGHVVKAFVPRFRCKFGKSSDPRLLDELERRGLVVYTPSREINGRLVTSYDDRYIVQCAAEFNAVIVSGDNYRDLHKENPRWRPVIERRLLPFTWVEDMIMFPQDPLGRHGPSLQQFLRHSDTNIQIVN